MTRSPHTNDRVGNLLSIFPTQTMDDRRRASLHEQALAA